MKSKIKDWFLKIKLWITRKWLIILSYDEIPMVNVYVNNNQYKYLIEQLEMDVKDEGINGRNTLEFWWETSTR